MGLPGSGKTKLAKRLLKSLKTSRITTELVNADDLRTKADDWDFSVAGRIRQAKRVSDLAETSAAEICVIDMVAALPMQRIILDPDILIYMNTIENSRYEDTNHVFKAPLDPDIEFKNHLSENVMEIIKLIKEVRCV
jgi:adenylylsulfate kinase